MTLEDMADFFICLVGCMYYDDLYGGGGRPRGELSIGQQWHLICPWPFILNRPKISDFFSNNFNKIKSVDSKCSGLYVESCIFSLPCECSSGAE